MANPTDKLYRVKADFQIMAVELQYSASFGRGQFVRLNLDQEMGTITEAGGKKNKSRPVKLREITRLECLEEVDEAAKPDTPKPELEDGAAGKTEGD